MTARVCHHEGQPWLIIEAAAAAQGGAAIIVYDGPLNLSSKRVIRDEIEWAHERSGLDRPALYDAVRAYQNQQRWKGKAA